MGQFIHLREQAERCRRLARDSTDPVLRDSLLRLAAEYAARARAPRTDDTPAWRAGSEDKGAT